MTKVRLVVLEGIILILPLLVAVQIVALPAPVKVIQRVFRVDQLAGLSPKRIDRITGDTLGYLWRYHADRELLSVYGDREIAHLVDVRTRFWQARAVMVVSILTLAVGSGLDWWLGFNLGLIYKWVATAYLLLGLSFLFIFPAFFELFHRLLFESGTYLFNERDLLIRLFPYEFWWLAAALLMILAEMVMGIVWFVIQRYLGLRRQQLAGFIDKKGVV